MSNFWGSVHRGAFGGGGSRGECPRTGSTVVPNPFVVLVQVVSTGPLIYSGTARPLSFFYGGVAGVSPARGGRPHFCGRGAGAPRNDFL